MTTDSAYPALSIIMPCYNRAYDLIRALQSYDQQSGDEPFELIAIDDASTDTTYQVLREYRPRRYELRIERMEHNQGPAAARNRGITLARAPIILFVGDDIRAHPDLVRGHLIAHRIYSQPESAVLGYIEWPEDLTTNNLMRHIDGPGAEQFCYYYLKDGLTYDFRYFYTANVSLKRDFLLELDHWFDTEFPFAAFEDVELAYRLSQRGMKLYYSRHLICYHYHYHTVWSFATRQYRAGLMACVLLKKHPELTPLLLGKSWNLRKRIWGVEARYKPEAQQDVSSLEEAAIHRASDLEADPDPQLHLTSFFIGLLKYFYFKGLIYGTFGDTPLAQRVHNLYGQRTLPALLAMPVKSEV